VQFPGLQRVEDSLQAIRQSLLHHNRRQRRELANSFIAHAILRLGPGQILWKCLLTRPHLQFPQGKGYLSKTYFILDELLIAGSVCESNKSHIHKELQIHKDIFDEKEEKNSKK